MTAKREINYQVGRFMKQVRESRFMTLEDAVMLLGRSVSWLSNIENGKRAIRFEDFLSLCAAYRLPPDVVTRLIIKQAEREENPEAIPEAKVV